MKDLQSKYDHFINAGVTSLPKSYAEFESAMKDKSGGAQKIYKGLQDEGVELPEFDEFYSVMMPEETKAQPAAKSQPTTTSQPAIQAQPTAKPSATPMTEREQKAMIAKAEVLNQGIDNIIENTKVDNLSKVNQPLKTEVNLGTRVNQIGDKYITTTGNEYDTPEQAKMEQFIIDESQRQRKREVDMVRARELDDEINNEKENLKKIKSTAIKTSSGFMSSAGGYLPYDPTAASESEKKIRDLEQERRKVMMPMISEQLTEVNSRIETLNEEINNLKGGKAEKYSFGPSATTRVDDKVRLKNKELSLAMEERDALELMINGDDKNFFSGLIYGITRPSTYTFGLYDLAMSQDMLNAKNAYDKGALTDEQKQFMAAYERANTAKSELDQNAGSQFRFGNIAAQSAPFMLEFFGTGGMGGIQAAGTSLAKRTAVALTKNMAKGMAKNFTRGFIKNTGIALGDIAAAGTMAVTTGGARTASDIINRYTGHPVQTDKGFTFKDGTTLADAIYKGLTGSTIEYYTEMLGTHMESVFPWIKSVVGKRMSQFAENVKGTKMGFAMAYGSIGLKKLGELADKSGIKAIYNDSKKAMKLFGLQSYPYEALEEEAGIVLNSMLTGDNKISDLIDGRTQEDIWGGMLYSIGMMQGITGGYSAIKYYGLKHKLSNQDVVCSNLFGDQWASIKEQIDNATNTNLLKTIFNIRTKSAEERKALLSYGGVLSQFRGFNTAVFGETEDKADNNTPGNPVTDAINRGFTDGYNSSDEETAKIEKDLNDKKELLNYDPGMSESDQFQSDVVRLQDNQEDALDYLIERYGEQHIGLATDYYNALNVYNGITQRKADEDDDRLTHLNQQAERNEYKGQEGQSGNVITADMGGNKVYIVRGDVNTETGEMSGAIVVRDEQGKIIVTNGNALTLESVRPLEEIKQENAENVAAERLAKEQEMKLAKEQQQQQEEQPQDQPQDNQDQPQDNQLQQPQDNQEQPQEPVIDEMPMIGEGEEAEPDFYSAAPSRTRAFIYDESGWSEEDANDFVDVNIESANREVKSVEKKKPKASTSFNKYKKELEAWKQELEQAKKKADYWQQVKDEHLQKKEETPQNIEATEGENQAPAVENAPVEEQVNQPGEGITAFEKKNSVSGNTTNTAETTEGGMRNDTATSQNTVSAGEVTNISENEQGNPINDDGSLNIDIIESIDELTDDDFNNPSRNVQLPALPKNVDEAIGANGKPVIIKKNIFEKNLKNHKFSSDESRKILKSALYNTDLVGQTQPTKKPLHWVAIKLDNKSPIVVLEVNENKDNTEIVGWYTLDERNLERIKRQANKNGGELIVLSPKDKVESLSTPLDGLSSAGKVTNTPDNEQDETEKKDESKSGVKEYRVVGGNSGYVGYSMSKRAAQAREEGRFPKTDFKKVYGLSDRAFDMLVRAGIIDDSEWHHTSKFGNKTTFYFWAEDVYAEIYAANKKEIDAIAKKYNLKNQFESPEVSYGKLPKEYRIEYRKLDNDRWKERNALREEYKGVEDGTRREEYLEKDRQITEKYDSMEKELEKKYPEYAAYKENEDNWRNRADEISRDRKKMIEEVRSLMNEKERDMEMRDVVIELLQQSGIEVITNEEEAQRVLDEAQKMLDNGGIREHKLSLSYYPRLAISPVRGKWTKSKIIKRLKDIVGTKKGYSFAARRIAEFDSAEELAEHMFYHGTQFGSGRLKPSILMSDSEVERIGGGGYGQKYWGISLSKSKRIASNFSTGRSVRVYPIILVKNAKIKEMPELSDAADLEDYIEDLWAEGVDAVWIGDKNRGEQELCVINPAAIVNIDNPDIYEYYKLGTSENPLNIIDNDGINKLYQDAKRYVNALENKPKKPEKPSRFLPAKDGETIGEMKSDEQYQKEMSEYERKLDEYNNSDEVRRFQQEDEYAYRNIRFFKTPSGHAYGFTVDGKIYVDKKIAGSETPIHEYSHLWAAAMRQVNPEEWKNIVDLMKGTTLWEEVKKMYPELTTDDDIADEVLAHYSGKRGAERLKKAQEEAMKQEGLFDKAATLSAIYRVKEALSRFWKGVADFIGVHFTSAEEVADKVLSDLLNGVNPAGVAKNGEVKYEQNSEEADIVARSKADGTYMKAPNGKPTNLKPRQWVQVRTKAFKEWFGDWEKAARIDKLRKSKSASITGKEIEVSDDYKQNKNNALEYGKMLQGEYTNADTGISVQLQRGRKNGGIKEVLQHNYKDVPHVLSVAAIPQIIEKSIYIESEPNNDIAKNPNVVEYQHFVCGLKIGTDDYTVHSLVAVDKFGNRYYDHNLTHIEKTNLLDQVEGQAVNGQGFDTTSGTKPTTLSGYKGKQLLELLQTNSSKVVDENGEPLVVYHQTSSDFWEFNTNNERAGKYDNETPTGIFFKTSDRRIRVEGSKQMHCFIKADDVLTFVDRNELSSYWKDNVVGYGDLQSKIDEINRKYKTESERLEAKNDELYKENYKDIVAGNLSEAKSKYLSEFEEKLENIYAEWDNQLKQLMRKQKDLITAYVNANKIAGIHLLNDENVDTYIVFEPTQIKSATDNIGTFDPNNPDIRYQLSTAENDLEAVNERSSSRMSEGERKSMEALAGKLGYKIVWHETMEQNGLFDPNTRTIHIALDAENPISSVFGHETMHKISENEEDYQSVLSLAKSILGEEEFSRRVDEIEKLYREAGYDKPRSYYEEEAVCDFMGELVTNNRLLERVCWDADHRILAAIRDVIERLLSAFIGENKDQLMHVRLVVSAAYNNAIERAKAENKQPTAEEEKNASLRRKKEVDDKSAEYMATHKTDVSQETFDSAQKAMDDMADMMTPYYEATALGKRILPEERYSGEGAASTIFNNGSYGKTMENTLKCIRTLAYNEFTDSVKKILGRPLTQKESFLASQMVYDIATDPQCLYCYVSLDRKAYDEFLLRYINQRDSVLEAFRGMTKKEQAIGNKAPHTALPDLYNQFLDGRKDTKEQQYRFDLWIRNEIDGIKQITASDLSTSDTRKTILNGLDTSLARQIRDAEKYAQSASWAKKDVDYISYIGELLKLSVNWIKKLTGEYGLRFYSFSEYTPAFLLENMQMVRDAALRSLNGLAYTKEVDFVKVFAPTGMNINCSCYGRMDNNGNMQMDTLQGADWEEVKALREKYPNVGSVFVATNDAAVEWALAQYWVDVVIPFHIVRTGKDIADFYGWTNYSKEQADNMIGSSRSMYISPVEHKNDKATFLEACERHGVTPRFSQWIDNPNYMKLVNETRLSVDETTKLQPIFDMNAAKDSWDRFVNIGGYYNGWWNVDAEGYADAVKRVVEDIRNGKMASEVDYGRQNIPVNIEKMVAAARKKKIHGNVPLVDVYDRSGNALTEKKASLRRNPSSNTPVEDEKNDLKDENISLTEEDANLYRQIEDEGTEEWLEGQPTIKTYRSMAMIDGKLYPPMSSKAVGSKELRNPSELGKWEEAEEAPDKAKKKGDGWYYTLTKDNGKQVRDVAYNPYIHTSTTMLNDQFSEAQSRDNLVVVEMEVPASELSSGYKAEKATDSVGVKQWKAGVIQGKLTGTREVILTRWAKPVRIVPVEEVADNIFEMINGEIDVMPTNVVTPQLRKALEDRGVKFIETDNSGKIISGDNAGKTWSSVYGKKAKNKNSNVNKQAASNKSNEQEVKSPQKPIYTEAQKEGFAKQEKRRVGDAAREMAAMLGIEDDVEFIETNEGLTGREATAKGWFNRKTGKIVVVLGNHISQTDVLRTIIHEGVAHYGLRKLLGEIFDTFLDEVFKNAEQEVKESILELSKKHGYNIRTATEEYLASLAEKMDFEKAKNSGWWTKIKSMFLDMMRQLGLGTYVGPALTDNELRYLLWRSYENLAEPNRYNNPFAEAKDTSKQLELKVGGYENRSGRVNATSEKEGDLLFRDGDFTERDEAIARDAYENAMRSGSVQFIEEVQDSMRSLVELYKAILGKNTRVEDIEGFENPYMFENRLSSMNMAQQHLYFINFMKPILKAVNRICKGNDKKREELINYMMAKHGLERNLVFARRDAEQKAREEFAKELKAAEKSVNDDPLDMDAVAALEDVKKRMQDLEEKLFFENREKDYGGITGLMGIENLRDAEDAAKTLVNDYEWENDLYITDLWNAVNAATQATLEKFYESGIISKDSYENIRDMFQYYIPLQGWDETTSDEVYAYLIDRKQMAGAPIKHAKGRRSKAGDPIATIGMRGEMAVMQSNRNLMKQTFLNFVLDHPSDLVSVSELWLEYDEVNDEWKPVFVDIEEGDTGEDIKRKTEAFEQQMEALRKQDPKKYKKSSQAQNIPYKVVPGNLKPHQVVVKRNGKSYVLTINGNPKAAMALNGLTNPDVEQKGFNKIMNAATYVNRKLSIAYTTANINFTASNFVRDMVYSNTMAWIKESPWYALNFHWNFSKYNPAMMRRLFGKWENGALNLNNKTEKLFYDFMKNGGETGFSNVRDIEAQKKFIISELKKENSLSRKSLSLLVSQLDMLNRSVENTARFAAFVTSREVGRSIERSVYDAKEVSVNFNKKGSGGRFLGEKGQTALGNVGSVIGGSGRIGYVFWNAGIQGLSNIGKNMGRHKIKGIAGLAAMYILGRVIPMLYGDDDDNSYYDIPEKVRRSNICIKVGEQWVTISLPIEFRAIYGLGELATGVESKNDVYTDKELAYQIGSQISQILPIDFLEGDGGVKNFVPTLLRPSFEAYINESWTGLPIYKDTPWNKNMPSWTKAYKNANVQLVDFAKFVSEITGGDEYKKGAIDINPAQVEHVLSGLFGGYVIMGNQLIKMAETATGERDFDWRNMIIANRVITNGDERVKEKRTTGMYYKIKEEVEEKRRLINSYRKDEMDEKADKLETPEYENALEDLKESQKNIKDIKEMIDETSDKDIQKELNKLIRQEEKTFVERHKNIIK